MASSATFCARRRVAVLFGAALWDGGTPSNAMRRRTEAAARLWHRQAVDLIIPSGGSTGAGPTEAEVMRGLLITAGVPPDAIEMEPEAKTTWQTACHVATMLGPQDALFLVTDGYHLPRCELAFRAFGIRAVPSPEPVVARASLSLLRQSLREIPALALYLIRFARTTIIG